MIPVEDIQFYDSRTVVDGIPMTPREVQPTMINTNSAWRTLDEVELMQFTGLLDKNGKEIYEGDVIEVDWSKAETQRYEVVFEQGNFCYSYEEAHHGKVEPVRVFYQLDLAHRWAMVIGNIYESPELLMV